MARIKMKLLMAGAGLVIALVMMSVGTFAWFTLSTKPEVAGISVTMESTGKEWPFEMSTNYEPPTEGQTQQEAEDNAAWTKDLGVFDLGGGADNTGDLQNLGPLRPITTYDGEHWYLPTYSAEGHVDKFTEVDLYSVMNRIESPGTEEAGNYVISFSFWVRTRDPDTSYALKLNNPNSNGDGTYHVHDDEELFGTFVLPWPKAKDGGGFSTEDTSLNAAKDGMTCLRIGFKVEGEEDFYIYEPNADKRSQFTGGGELGGLKYIGQNSLTVNDTAQRTAGVQTTMVPRFKAGEGGAQASYEMMAQPVQARQAASSWNETALASASKVDSKLIGTIGNFYRTDNTTEFITSYSELPAITTVTKGQPKKITVYVWLEGQDIDCWNQIASSSIYGNLEFRGDAVPSEPSEP